MADREFHGSAAIDQGPEDDRDEDRPSGEITKEIDVAIEIQTAEEIQKLRMAVRQQLIIFTEDGGGRKLIHHDMEWRKKMDDINRLTLSSATEQQEIEALGERAKALIIEAWQTKPAVLRKQIIEDLRLLIEDNPVAKQLVMEELHRIRREDLAEELFA